MTGEESRRPSSPLKGRRILVTGSSSGIGRAIAEKVMREGADVIVHANRTFARAEELALKLSGEGRRALALSADLRDPAACDRLVEAAFESFGGIDGWVNNAGADVLTPGERKQTFDEKLAALLDVDVRATIRLTREVGRRMGASGGGSIVNLGWDKASTGMAGDSGELYAAAKAAVIAFSKSAALSLAPRVRVNCISPGWIRTAWGQQAGAEWDERVVADTPLRRWGEPDDVAAVAAFLVSEESRFLTGQVLCVNGGSVR